MQQTSQATRLKLEVLAGVHRGVTLLLDSAEFRIGSSPQADIILSDPGVAAEHAILRVDRAGVRIDAIGAEVGVAQDRIPVAHGCRTRLPVDIVLGEAELLLSRPDLDADLQSRSHLGAAAGWLARKPVTAAGTLLGFVLAVTFAVQDGAQTIRAERLFTKASRADASDARADFAYIAGPRTADGRATAEQAARELGARLDAAKIQGLRVSALDGRLTVTGKLGKQEAADWAAIQQWFDQTYGSRIVLTASISAGAERQAMPSLQLQAIWYGEHPYIITTEGARFYQGAVLDNGWIVREIGEDRLLLAREGETVALTYR
jgi:Inner membrane component of T3SS, cytoplasmic domain/Inner membrane component of T3SS, periplasmic domain